MEEFKIQLIETLVPAIISELLLNGKIKEDCSADEIKQSVISYLKSEQFESMKIAITIGDEFEDAIKNAIKAKHDNVAIALAGVCIEQIINEFYQKVLFDKYNFSNREITSCMKCVSVKDKLTWLYKLITSQSIDNQIVASVQNVCNLRNKIVHYKPRIENLCEWESIEKDSNKIHTNELIPLIENLKNILKQRCLAIFPEDKISHEIFEKFYKKEK
ncbi:MAG: hypothetical protein ACLSVG_02305 [Clostridia bacterium]